MFYWCGLSLVVFLNVCSRWYFDRFICFVILFRFGGLVRCLVSSVCRWVIVGCLGLVFCGRWVLFVVSRWLRNFSRCFLFCLWVKWLLVSKVLMLVVNLWFSVGLCSSGWLNLMEERFRLFVSLVVGRQRLVKCQGWLLWMLLFWICFGLQRVRLLLLVWKVWLFSQIFFNLQRLVLMMNLLWLCFLKWCLVRLVLVISREVLICVCCRLVMDGLDQVGVGEFFFEFGQVWNLCGFVVDVYCCQFQCCQWCGGVCEIGVQLY